jgi:predicted HAD superfamily hydrolase
MSRLDNASIPSNCKICSFDIFDTLLYRRCGMPETVFGLMEAEWSRRLGCPPPRDFAKLRTGAEAKAQRRLGRDTVSIAEIYEDLEVSVRSSGLSNQALIEFELELEKSVLVPVPGAAELVGSARAEGKRVVFTSDTYMPVAFLSELLTKFGFMMGDDRLYASAERGASKTSGELYKVVQRDLQLPASAFLHTGNSEEVDFKCALKNSWNATHFTDAEWTRREWLLWHLVQAERGLSAKVHAASRNARLSAAVKGESEETAHRIGAATAGPVLLAFSQWVLEQAQSRGLEELFFLSRDAQVVFEICRLLAQRPGVSAPKLTYVYGSRQVWAFYALQSLTESERPEFFADKLSFSSNSLKECADLLGLAGNTDVDRLIASLDKAPSRPPSRNERIAFYRALLADNELAELLQAELANRTAIYIDYLRALPVKPGADCGVVDIGWSGMWTEVFGAMLREAGAKEVLGLQMGRARSSHPEWNVPVDCFLFDQRLGTGISSPPGWLVPLLEVFCGADHGRVTSMELSSGTIRPVESTRKFGGMSEMVFRSFREGIFAFAREWKALTGDSDETVGTTSSLVELLKQFWLFPTSGEARFVQGVDIGMAPNADQDRCMLRPYKFTDLSRLLLTSRLPGFEPTWWHRGALAITAMPLALSVGIVDHAILILKSGILGQMPISTAIPVSNVREHGKFLRWLFLPQKR